MHPHAYKKRKESKLFNPWQNAAASALNSVLPAQETTIVQVGPEASI